MGMYDNCPCRGCVAPKRQPGCHGECPEKAAWDGKVSEAKEAIRKEKARSGTALGFISDSVHKTEREMRRLKRK